MLVLSEDYSIKKFDFIDKEEENECLILKDLKKLYRKNSHAKSVRANIKL